MDATLRKWRDDGKHLPEFLRDFHEAKDFFQALKEFVEIDDGNPAKDISAMTAQIYVVDVLLWYLARHGYTLQRSRARLEFDDIRETVAAFVEERRLAQELMLKADARSDKPD
ncbi:hypothetical protein F6X40_11485 [Paraburkholderia sp. UCT31]|uniref:hypothetical protein n=1 Tax=Paraburkholderia sp. UCT31 TaxID=2615209 RepID=UPI001654EF26|nr:hypothetical protein [Paraburkholderia sp. UCT31]MBC8737427.1 hypothetical protein [Paraburkholderia sp. UCT31]